MDKSDSHTISLDTKEIALIIEALEAKTLETKTELLNPLEDNYVRELQEKTELLKTLEDRFSGLYELGKK